MPQNCKIEVTTEQQVKFKQDLDLLFTWSQGEQMNFMSASVK